MRERITHATLFGWIDSHLNSITISNRVYDLCVKAGGGPYHN